MAGLSISRRRAAWNAGIEYAATGKSAGQPTVPKLREIFDRGAEFARANPTSPEVRVAKDAAERRAERQKTAQSKPKPPPRRGYGRR